ncbi:MAG: CoA pyrophosphatase [SAR202 cluster bacterium]|nr:CoA pyrophosphatase [SAR202 cluster bacterium]|tara:strand:- start:83702 stop:84316 length:615 start_codon:yes stop_codon:yes gene_type:complete
MQKSYVSNKRVSLLDKLKQKLFHNLNDIDDFNKLIPSAVMILLYEKNDEVHVTLTKRSMDLKLHKGEFCFPGGTQEITDENLLTSAIRECKEEIGIFDSDFEILGRLPGYAKTSTHYIVGFIGKTRFGYKYHLNDQEVNSIIEIPLKKLMNPSNMRYEYLMDENDRIKKICCFGYNGNYIFGATAVLLSNLICVFEAIEGNKCE